MVKPKEPMSVDEVTTSVLQELDRYLGSLKVTDTLDAELQEMIKKQDALLSRLKAPQKEKIKINLEENIEKINKFIAQNEFGKYAKVVEGSLKAQFIQKLYGNLPQEEKLTKEIEALAQETKRLKKEARQDAVASTTPEAMNFLKQFPPKEIFLLDDLLKKAKDTLSPLAESTGLYYTYDNDPDDVVHLNLKGVDGVVVKESSDAKQADEIRFSLTDENAAPDPVQERSLALQWEDKLRLLRSLLKVKPMLNTRENARQVGVTDESMDQQYLRTHAALKNIKEGLKGREAAIEKLIERRLMVEIKGELSAPLVEQQKEEIAKQDRLAAAAELLQHPRAKNIVESSRDSKLKTVAKVLLVIFASLTVVAGFALAGVVKYRTGKLGGLFEDSKPTEVAKQIALQQQQAQAPASPAVEEPRRPAVP